MTESIHTAAPLIGLQMTTETAQYVGMLEGTVAALVVNECKYRALLEILTGDSWEATKVDMNPNALMALAVSALVKQTGMDPVRAKTLVSMRWSQHNDPVSAIVPQAVSVETMVSTNPPEAPKMLKNLMQERFSAWKAKQVDAAEQLNPVATLEPTGGSDDPANLATSGEVTVAVGNVSATVAVDPAIDSQPTLFHNS